MAKRVLFVCIHNSARSQIAEELLIKYGGDEFEVQSAGFEPGELNPLVVEILQEDEGIDITRKEPNSVFDFFQEGKTFHYVITVCDEANAQKCPIFPGMNHRIHWSFDDPSEFEGNTEEKKAKIREVKELIYKEIMKLIKLIKDDSLKQSCPKNWIIS